MQTTMNGEGSKHYTTINGDGCKQYKNNSNGQPTNEIRVSGRVGTYVLDSTQQIP